MAVVTVTVPPTSTWPAGRPHRDDRAGRQVPVGYPYHARLQAGPAQPPEHRAGWLTRQGGVVDYDHPGRQTPPAGLAG
jgi:hypothetical protein